MSTPVRLFVDEISDVRPRRQLTAFTSDNSFEGKAKSRPFEHNSRLQTSTKLSQEEIHPPGSRLIRDAALGIPSYWDHCLEPSPSCIKSSESLLMRWLTDTVPLLNAG